MSREQANRSVARAFMRWILAAFFAAGGVAHLTAPQALVYTICLWLPISNTQSRASQSRIFHRAGGITGRGWYYSR